MTTKIIAILAYVALFGLVCWQYSVSDTDNRSIMFYFLAFLTFGQMVRYEFKLAKLKKIRAKDRTIYHPNDVKMQD